ncbi:MAG TPA: hypothetical protein PKA16_02115 [Ottowia sp.]|uniref:hypothetical protein n=1 Tax=Ottowia sp. TaxID=1898956 RepID=UPI002BA28C17|nr:hypothetical protein [Ottowia sp.]HMN20167.1 hypothetical protein [Ottowia sp.]
MKRFVFIPLVAGLALPLAGWGQAVGESAATPAAATPPGAAQVDEAAAQRSALWKIIEAQSRPDDAQVLAQDRRLTPEQRLELREQVRQAWHGLHAGQATASAADQVPIQP